MSRNSQSQAIQLPFAPIPLVGETLYSLICRFIQRSGLPSKMLLQNLTGQPKNTAFLSLLPGYISQLSKTLPDGHPWQDPNEIVIKHTALPYITYFDTPIKRTTLIERLAEATSNQSISMSLGLTQYKSSPFTKHPRFCPTCTKEDKHNNGFTYFRIEHQLPGVAVCYKHGDILCNGCSTCGTYPLKGHPFTMPGLCNCIGSISNLPAFNKIPTNRDGLLWFAKQSAYMLKSNGTESENIRRDLRTHAINAGFSRGSRLVYKELAHAIELRFGNVFLDWIGAPVWCGSQPAPWVRRLLYGQLNNEKRSPVIYYILIIGTLFDSIQDFEHKNKHPHDHNFNISPPTVNSDTSVTSTEHEQLDLEDLLIKHQYKLTVIGAFLGIREYSLTSQLRNQRIRVPLTKQVKKRLGDETLEAIRNNLRQGITKKEIMKLFSCSEWTLILIELDDPSLNESHKKATKENIRTNHRTRLLEFLSNNPNAARSDIKKKLPGVYDYLINSDKDWFYKKIPECKQRSPQLIRQPKNDWGTLDEKMSEKLKSSINDTYNCDDKPVWVTIASTLKIIGLYVKYTQHPDKFPKVTKILNKHTETRKEFEIRRISWAVQQSAKSDTPISVNKLRRIASLPAPKVRRYKQEVIQAAKEFGVNIDSKSYFAGH